jgi:glutamate/tyrosine decarboxylase-like PLP-dependent enzyme
MEQGIAMSNRRQAEELDTRQAPLEMEPDEFRRIGHRVIDDIADFLHSLPRRPVTSGASPKTIRGILGDKSLPEQGMPADELLREAEDLLFQKSLFNGHPRFWGYITASAAPIGALGDLLAASVNPNVGAWALSPVASEVERQTIRWIADLIGYPASCGGLLVSGGNMANFVGLLAARKTKVPWDVRADGLRGGLHQLTIYASQDTHTWIHKAVDMFGLGLNAIHWIPMNDRQQMDPQALARQILADRSKGFLPFLVVGSAGTVGVGAIDPLADIAAICRREGLWFHVDGAYGAPAVLLPEAPAELRGLRESDSVAIDPHKWLYSPLEAGCALVREPKHLVDAFSFHPDYYHFETREGEALLNYYELGPQNSRGFRALKVWLALRLVGKEGYARMIRDDIALAEALHQRVKETPELQAFTRNLSIVTFRFVPKGLAVGNEAVEGYLNSLNLEILNRLQDGGEVYLSNAVIKGTFLLRACIVNFRTRLKDIKALVEIVTRTGKVVDARMRPQDLGASEIIRPEIAESRPLTQERKGGEKGDH